MSHGVALTQCGINAIFFLEGRGKGNQNPNYQAEFTNNQLHLTIYRQNDYPLIISFVRISETWGWKGIFIATVLPNGFLNKFIHPQYYQFEKYLIEFVENY